MLRAWRRNRKDAMIKDGTFLKFYIWTSILGGK